MACLIFLACGRTATQSGGTFQLTKVLMGATTIPAQGAKPIEDSVIVIRGHTIQAVGARKDVSMPQSADRTDLAGRWVVPLEGSRIAVNEMANLMVLERAPNGIKPESPADVGARIVNGDWEQPARR